MVEIKHLGELLKPHIDQGWCYVNYTCERLTATGENYGSLILSLQVRLENSKKEERILHLVAKMIPENPFMREMFKVQDTFVKEMNFYCIVVPTLVAFQLEEGIEKPMDLFPKYFGGRINLKPNSPLVDEDGIIMLENLKLDGYVTGDRTVGFDKETSALILKNLAVFHAVPMALKMKKPKVFEEKIKPHIKFVRMFSSSDEKLLEPVAMYEKMARGDPRSARAADRIRPATIESLKAWGVPRDDLFATVTHNDFWVNNTMLKFDENGKPISNKMVDFQLVDYGSLAKDVVVFLFCSVNTAVFEEYYDHLLKVYYDNFINTLRDLHCDTTPFTFEALEKELGIIAKDEFLHCLVMTKPVNISPGKINDVNDMFKEDNSEKYHPSEKSKVQFIVREFAKRNWI